MGKGRERICMISKRSMKQKMYRDAIRLLTEHPQAQIIAGGSDVLVRIREGKRAGAELVSIYGLDELRGVSLEEDETLRIRSLTSFFPYHKKMNSSRNIFPSLGKRWIWWEVLRSAISGLSEETHVMV